MSNLLKGKGNYTKIQNQMIIWAAKRVLEEAGDSEKIEMFKGFCETKIDPELKMVDFIFDDLNYCYLPGRRSGAESYDGPNFLKLFYWEVDYKGVRRRAESLISQKNACLDLFLKIAIEEKDHIKISNMLFLKGPDVSLDLEKAVW